MLIKALSFEILCRIWIMGSSLNAVQRGAIRADLYRTRTSDLTSFRVVIPLISGNHVPCCHHVAAYIHEH